MITQGIVIGIDKVKNQYRVHVIKSQKIIYVDITRHHDLFDSISISCTVEHSTNKISFQAVA